MRDLLLCTVSVLVLSAASAHHEVHLVPAHVLCPNVTGEQDILLPSPTDCSVYYKCENGMAIPQSCPDGLEWCKVLSQCTLPMLANCSLSHTLVTYSPEELATYNPNAPTTTNPTTPEDDGLCPFDGAKLPNPVDCTSYYVCENGEPVSHSCPTGEKYSCWDQQCEPDAEAVCINSGNLEGHNCTKENEKLPSVNNCTSYYECVNGQVVTQSCPEGLYFSPWDSKCTDNKTNCEKYEEGTTSSPTETTTESTTDELCPFDGAKLPNAVDCTSYYVCENGEPVSHSCPTGEKYSCWDQQCEPDAEAVCINSGNLEGHNCTKGNEKLPNVNNCTTYYQCVNGEVVLESCPKGLYFTPWDSKCADNKTQCEKYLEGSQTSTVSPTETTTEATTDELCPFDGAKLPNAVDCTSYYVCENGEPVSHSCPTGEKYSCWDQQCEPDAEAVCINSGNLEGHNCTKGNEKLPNVNNCTTYYQCVNGEVVLESCPEGLYFTPWDSKCTDNKTQCEKYLEGSQPSTVSPTETTTAATEGTTKRPSILCPVGSDGILYPSNKGDCQGYLECINRQPVAKKCDPPTFNYNCETKKCENITHCCATPQTTTPNGLSTSNTPSVGSSDSTPNPSSEDPSETTSGNPIDTSSPSNPTSEGPSESTSGNPTDTSSPSNPTSEGPSESTSGNPTDTSSPSNPTSEGPSEGPSESTSGNPTDTSSPSNPTSEGPSESTSGNPTDTSSPSNPTSEGPSESTSGNPTDTSSPSNPTSEGPSESTSGNPTDTSSPSNPTSEGPSESTSGNPTDTSSPSNPTSGDPSESTSGNPTDTSSPSNPTSEGPSESTSGNPTDTSSPSNPTSGGPSESTSGNPIDTSSTVNPTSGGSNTESTSNNPTDTSSPSNPTSGDPSESTSGNPIDTSSPSNPTSEGPSESTSGNPTDTSSPSNPTSEGPSESTSGNPIDTSSPSNPTSEGPSESTSNNPTDTSSPSNPTSGGPSESTSGNPIDTSSTVNPTSGGSNTESTSNNPTDTSSPSNPTSGGPSSESTSEAPGTDITISPSGSTSTSQIPGGSIMCPPGQDGLLYPSYTGDCQGYLECVKGQLVPKKCDPPTYNYNCETKKCENISHCCASPTTTSGEVTTVTTPETTTKITSPTSDSDICPEDGAKIPNAVDCTAYYVCENKNPVPQKCPDGEEYSCWDQTCKKPTDATCIKTGSQQGQTCKVEGEQNAKIDDCSSYYKCVGGKVTIVKCASGKFYNKWFKACFSFTLAWCQTYPTIPPTSTIEPPPSTEAPSPDDNICPMEGAKLPNVQDCYSYYVCINSEPTLQNCPNNEVYSCWDQTCLPQEEGHCILFENSPGGNCSIDGLQSPNIRDCKGYYECKNHSLVAMTCPDGKMYNSWFKKCVDDKLAHCQTVSTPAPTGPTSPPTTTSKITVSPSPDVCPEDGAQLPNPTDCTAYYVCQKGKPVPHTCPKGQEYSCWDQKCMKPSSNSTCIKDGNQEGHSCSIAGQMMPNIANCSSFYICINGKVELHVCAGGAFYSSWFKMCFDVSIVGQIALQFCKVFPTLPPFTLPPLPTTTIAPSLGNDVCPVEHALLPNPLDCSTYYECINNAPILQSCPPGMGYSCWDQQCVNGSDNECVVSVGPGANRTCSKNGVKVADAKDCSKYYECASGKIVTRYCILGLQFNSRFQKCVFAKYSHCTPINISTTSESPETSSITPSPVDDVCPNDGALLPNPVNCSTYYKCINGTPVAQLCAAGLEYSCWNMECMAPADAKCVAVGGIQEGQDCKHNGQTVPNPENCQTYYQCVNHQVVLKKCAFGGYYNKWFHICLPFAVLAHCAPAVKPLTTTTTKPTTIPPMQIENDVCPVDGALLPDPTDCNGYYKCINNKPVAQKCPKGQAYSCWDQMCGPATTAQCISVGSQRGLNCTREGVELQNVQDCSSYYVCHNGVVEEDNCYLGFQYNRWYQKCTIGLYSHCKTTPIKTESPISTTTLAPSTVKYPNSLCAQDGAKVPNPNDCHTYFVCEYRTPVLHTCPDNENYDCWDQKCNFALLSRCVNTPKAQVGQLCSKEGQNIPNVVDCKKYYSCQNGVIVEKSCPFMQQYSVWGQRCVLIGLAKCANNKWLGIL